MRITLVQSDPVWGDHAASTAALEPMLPPPGSTDLVVLPEMFATGFVMEPAEVAENEGGQSLAWMRSRARLGGYAIAGSLSVESGGTFRNRFYFVLPDGKTSHYDKRHLFAYGGEDKCYSPGDSRTVVEHCGVRILLQVCYDLRFPVFSRNHLLPDGRADYDVVLYVANWPASRAGAWEALLRARAIENAAYAVGVNRTGSDPVCGYSGGSAVFGPKGECLVADVAGDPCSLDCVLDMESLWTYRRKFPVLEDADR